jgi:hypothetical protein
MTISWLNHTPVYASWQAPPSAHARSLPDRLLGITWSVAPADRATQLGAFLHPGYTFNSTIFGLNSAPATATCAIVTGSRKRRGPAEPGLR